MAQLHLADEQDPQSTSDGGTTQAPSSEASDGPVAYPFPNITERTERLQELLHLLQENVPQTEDIISHSIMANQRQFARCAFSTAQSTGTLSINHRRFNCRVIEMSIGGFGVVVDGFMKMAPGTIGSLRAPGLNFIVSVTRQEPRQDGMFVGLRQLEEVVEPHQYGFGKTLPAINYVMAGLAGALVAVASIYFMNGH